ncbi:hypothetical protein [Spiroplasma turonicum]|uniref:Uncharacterized protein n=1 Tax=Spiroplasma turonicum TaxID=216946 RepID=A0A0K1P5W3_9MOLU|nr:hypothetical protein [Spiroplasma turonicum]AKU79650.1 hypothetical protein STURON_00404 [Spiroplasma turonicum]ALX70670.1 hypothetical protein STURO_v1c04020 [Spiroplasma turonicum]
MKITRSEIPTFNLPAPIRKRINDLVKLSINPTTINLITAEFSKASDETKENIGRYIARLIEIQNDTLESHYENIKRGGGVLNLKQELNITKVKSNLLRIQQIFMKKDLEEKRINNHLNNNIDSEQTLENLNFRDAMMIKNDLSSEEVNKRELLRKISNQKTRIENAISLEKSKLRKAKLLYLENKNSDDVEKIEKIKMYIKKTISRINEIINARNTYTNILDIPDSIIDGDVNNQNISDNQQNHSGIFLQIKESMKNTNTNTLNIDLKTFFDVPNFEQKKNLKTNNQSFDFLYFNNKNDVIENENKEVNLDGDLKKIKDLTIDKNIYISKKHEDDKKERIIKKIKKKSKAKDRKLEQIENDKKLIEEELIQLKRNLKVDELRSIEIHRKKSVENTNKILKRDKQKYETSFIILEKKWKAYVINNFLSSKQKAFEVMTNIKIKANLKDKKLLNNDDNNE